MGKMKTDKAREIVQDFAKEIYTKKQHADPPKEVVINFRNERQKAKPRPVYEVPVHLLKYRKDNGRIAADVYSYEKQVAWINEEDEEGQKILRNFLEKKDPEKTKELTNLIITEGQREPAIITADGFLINGNRRKMVFENLYEKTQQEENKRMKVVILPGYKSKEGDGGPPTIREIEEIENRYQLQSEGKAKYTKFDRALSIRRKIENNMSLEAQLNDDPNYAPLKGKEFDKALKNIENEYLKPLECVDRYLEYLKREQVYETIQKGTGDPEGRWQAFLDYYNNFWSKVQDRKTRIKKGIDENEVGDLEEIAFKIIRQRDLKDIGKVHTIMRKFLKLASNERSKNFLFELKDIDISLPNDKKYNKNGEELSERDKDLVWRELNRSKIINQVKKADDALFYNKERETPLKRLKEAYKKLEDKVEPDSIRLSDIDKAMALSRKIQKRANEIESELYYIKKGTEDLKNRFNG